MRADDLFAQITNQLIAEIESGAAGIWRMPWHTLTDAGTPVSVDGRPYRGMNAVWLPMVAATHGWAPDVATARVWGTYRAWQRHGAQVRRGERATHVVLWKQSRPAGTDDDTEPDQRRPRLFARASTVSPTATGVGSTSGANCAAASRRVSTNASIIAASATASGTVVVVDVVDVVDVVAAVDAIDSLAAVSGGGGWLSSVARVAGVPICVSADASLDPESPPPQLTATAVSSTAMATGPIGIPDPARAQCSSAPILLCVDDRSHHIGRFPPGPLRKTLRLRTTLRPECPPRPLHDSYTHRRRGGSRRETAVSGAPPTPHLCRRIHIGRSRRDGTRGDSVRR